MCIRDRLVGIQKKVILHARRDNKTVITAPQMMESMIHNLSLIHILFVTS